MCVHPSTVIQTNRRVCVFTHRQSYKLIGACVCVTSLPPCKQMLAWINVTFWSMTWVPVLYFLAGDFKGSMIAHTDMCKLIVQTTCCTRSTDVLCRRFLLLARFDVFPKLHANDGWVSLTPCTVECNAMSERPYIWHRKKQINIMCTDLRFVVRLTHVLLTIEAKQVILLIIRPNIL